MKNFYFLFALVCSSSLSMAEYSDSEDSTRNTKSTKASNVRLITRLHSLGQFTYGGRIVSYNPTLDFNFSYDRKNWGLLVFKAFDLYDHTTQINFTLAVINKPFHIGSRLTITPNAGVLLEQANTVADHGSDFVFIVNTAYKISGEWTVDYSTLVANIALEPEERDWVNRIRLLYSHRHLDFSVIGWHNNKVFDSAEYLTFGATAFYSRVKISSIATMNFGISGVIMPYSNDLTDYPKRNGINLTAVLVLD